VRGLGLELTCDETSFEGVGVTRLASVLERFFAKYVSINTTTELTLRTIQRGEVRQWPVRMGSRPVL